MALPKRNRRTIVVDDAEYHWTRGRSPENMWITIQLAPGIGSLLRIDTYGIPTPADIADAIRYAIANGWNPTNSSDAFYIGFTNQREFDRFVIRTAKSPDFWREFQSSNASNKVN